MAGQPKHDGSWRKRSVRLLPRHCEPSRAVGRGEIHLGAAKWVEEQQIANGEFAHLGISIGASGRLILPRNPVEPLHDSGSRAKWNRYGREITRNDLPKVQRSFEVHNPRMFGEYDVTYTRTGMFYRKERRFGGRLRIQIVELGRHEIDGQRIYVLGARLSGSVRLPKNRNDLDLVFRASLLLEQFGNVNTFPHEPTDDNLRSLVFLGWDLLPPELQTVQVARILSGKGLNSTTRVPLLNRLSWIQTLAPDAEFLTGSVGFDGYFLAKISDRCVIAENVMPGNAIYVFYSNWRSLSRRSRSWLRRRPNEPYERIEHDNGGAWRRRLRQIIAQHV